MFYAKLFCRFPFFVVIASCAASCRTFESFLWQVAAWTLSRTISHLFFFLSLLSYLPRLTSDPTLDTLPSISTTLAPALYIKEEGKKKGEAKATIHTTKKEATSWECLISFHFPILMFFSSSHFLILLRRFGPAPAACRDQRGTVSLSLASDMSTTFFCFASLPLALDRTTQITLPNRSIVSVWFSFSFSFSVFFISF